LSPAEKLALIRSLDGRVLWVGDGSDPRAKETLAASSISVSVAPLWKSHSDAADVQLVHTDLACLPRLVEFGRAHQRRLAHDYRAVHTVNLLGAAGAVFGNLTALHTGLLSNVPTAWIYARHALALDALARSADARRAALKHTPPA
jgi:cation transport ATPase